MQISKKKLAKHLEKYKEPSIFFDSEIRHCVNELLRCGKYHYQLHPDQIKTLKENIENTIDEMLINANEGKFYNVGATHYYIRITEEERYYEIEIYHKVSE